MSLTGVGTTTTGTSVTTVTSAAPTSSLKAAVSAISKPLGGLISVGIGICGFAVPAMHGLGTPFSTALIVAGLGAYGLSVGTVSAAKAA